MTITVETGAGVANANSYVTVTELRAYADARSITLPSADVTCEPLLIKAIDYIEAQRNRLKGYKKDSDNPLQFPRCDVWIDGYEVSDTSIPRELKYAQMQLACDAYTVDLMPNQLVTTKGAVVKQKVGDLEVAYDNPANPRSVPAFSKADALLAPLYKNNGMYAVRV